ncbi:MAG: hypothetical protein J7J96_09630 [Sulfurimonas sp.]|nr:hypothetical protein [Sulfurimonas sp.]
MEKIILLIFMAVLLFSDESVISKCNECHSYSPTPSYKKIHKHYLLKYSSKIRVKQAMIGFLKAPSLEKSEMSNGMKKRLKPENHTIFDDKTIEKAVIYIIEKEDIQKRFKKIS